MVHSGMDLIPSVGKHIAQVAAIKMYVELHKMDEVVGPPIPCFCWPTVGRMHKATGMRPSPSTSA